MPENQSEIINDSAKTYFAGHIPTTLHSASVSSHSPPQRPCISFSTPQDIVKNKSYTTKTIQISCGTSA